MDNKILAEIIEVISPYVKNKEALLNASTQTTFLKDLQVSSSRLVDIVLAMEDKFGIAISDEEADSISTLGTAVDLVAQRAGG